MSFVSFLQDGSGLGELLVQQPERYDYFLGIGKHIMTSPSELDEGERELIAAYVSALNGCAFCTGTHTAIAKEFGHSPELVQALLEDPATASLPERLVPVMQFVRKLTREPAKLTQADADAVTSAGWGEQALSDAAAVAAYFAMANRLADGHGVEALPAQDNEAIGKLIAKEGYPDVQGVRKPSGDGNLGSW